MKEIEVGIIGIEGIAVRNHLPSRQYVEGVPVIAVSNLDEERETISAKDSVLNMFSLNIIK